MFDEMSFLFEESSKIANQFNKTDTASKNFKQQVSSRRNAVQSAREKIVYNEKNDAWERNKYTVAKSSVDNYIKSSVNAAYKTSGKNPYISLLETFNGEGKNPKSLKLKPSDLAYLRDIGVYPINRLFILRRFPEGVVVPVDLNELDIEPISTVVGWIKSDSNLLSFDVNESWKTQNKWLHDLIRDIINSEFGIDIGNIFPIPGWGQGFLFGLLHDMGLTDYDAYHLPIGDANLLREGVMREYESQGIQSTFSFNMEVVYEQKYIGGIDPTSAFNDLLSNLLTMGTSNMRFLGKAGNKVARAMQRANNNPSDPNGWKQLIMTVIPAVIKSLRGTISNMMENDKSGIYNKEDKPTPDESDTKDGKEDKSKQTGQANLEKVGIIQKIVSSVLASTIARYQWPIRGALNQLTGEAATPWHLTIGNPYAPLLSINNIKVTSLDVTLGNEMAYNDIPRYMTTKINMSQGRNLGKQEIESMFGIEYKRKYKKV